MSQQVQARLAEFYQGMRDHLVAIVGYEGGPYCLSVYRRQGDVVLNVEYEESGGLSMTLFGTVALDALRLCLHDLPASSQEVVRVPVRDYYKHSADTGLTELPEGELTLDTTEARQILTYLTRHGFVI